MNTPIVGRVDPNGPAENLPPGESKYVNCFAKPISKANKKKFKNTVQLYDIVNNVDIGFLDAIPFRERLIYKEIYRKELLKKLTPLIDASVDEMIKNGFESNSIDYWKKHKYQ